MKYRHLSIVEREKLQELRWQMKSIRYIANELGRSASSVSREIKRNLPKERQVYTPRLAHERALKKRKSRGRKERLKNNIVRKYVTEHLKLGWSPEQISGCIHNEKKQHISHEAIYQYVYAQIYRNGCGYVKPECEDLRPYLRRKQKRRQKQGMRKSQRIFKPKGISIDLRPSVVNRRTRVGDWEGDTVESCHHKPGVNTLLERKTGMFFITKLKDKTSGSMINATTKRMHGVPKQFKHTLTLDNGPENQDWETLQKKTSLQVFYAHPYCSGERGANENANGLLREYFPKGTDFTTISEEEIALVEHRLNTRPRKRLGWKTPLEVWSVALEG